MQSKLFSQVFLVGLLVIASACSKAASTDAAPPSPAVEEQPKPVTTDTPNPNFDPSAAPAAVDKKLDAKVSDPDQIEERRVTLVFDATKLRGAAGDTPVVITVDHKKITVDQDCAKPLEGSRFGGDSTDEGPSLLIDLKSLGVKREAGAEVLAPDYEISASFSYTCGKRPLSFVMQNLDTGHQVTLVVTAYTKDTSLLAKGQVFVALNKKDGEHAETFDYPSAD